MVIRLLQKNKKTHPPVTIPTDAFFQAWQVQPSSRRDNKQSRMTQLNSGCVLVVDPGMDGSLPVERKPPRHGRVCLTC